MSEMYINYGAFAGRANTIKNENDKLMSDLQEIKRLINDGTANNWLSNAAETTRSKIVGMETRFQQYYDVVDNYVKLIRNTAQAYEQTEKTNDSNAQQFI